MHFMASGELQAFAVLAVDFHRAVEGDHLAQPCPFTHQEPVAIRAQAGLVGLDQKRSDAITGDLGQQLAFAQTYQAALRIKLDVGRAVRVEQQFAAIVQRDGTALAGAGADIRREFIQWHAERLGQQGRANCHTSAGQSDLQHMTSTGRCLQRLLQHLATHPLRLGNLEHAQAAFQLSAQGIMTRVGSAPLSIALPVARRGLAGAQQHVPARGAVDQLVAHSRHSRRQRLKARVI